jgi:hypothetical protein
MSWRRFCILKDALFYRKDSGLFTVLSPLVRGDGSGTSTPQYASGPARIIKREEARSYFENLLCLKLPGPDALKENGLG